jgi:lipoprotein-releasing system permease protein
LILCLIQQHFGLLRLGDTPGAYIVEAYPVVVKATDILIVFVSVSIIGFLAILYPIRNLKKYLKNDRIL